MARDVGGLFGWLVDGVPGATTPMDVLDHLCPGLLRSGIPVERVAAFVRTLHPQLMGRSFFWRAGGKTEVREASYAVLNMPSFKASPVSRVCETGEPFRCRLDGPAAFEYSVLHELAGQGLTDYLAVPMKFLSGEAHAITFASAAPGGFSDEDIDALLHVCRPLSRVAEILALSRTAVNLLNTYVGRNAGERILKGHILRGDTDFVRCVIWFSDLRGFTSMADSVPPAALIRTLNELFDCQVPAIERHGGEVLKFMGDGMLAIFPIVGAAPDAACESALAAAKEAFEALDEQNRKRSERGESGLRFGLALHVGDVAYGNIGGANRLDFTCIGPAVNLAARIESLASKLGKPLLLSAEMARHVRRETESVGEHELKGVSGKQTVFALA